MLERFILTNLNCGIVDDDKNVAEGINTAQLFMTRTKGPLCYKRENIVARIPFEPFSAFIVE